MVAPRPSDVRSRPVVPFRLLRRLVRRARVNRLTFTPSLGMIKIRELKTKFCPTCVLAEEYGVPRRRLSNTWAEDWGANVPEIGTPAATLIVMASDFDMEFLETVTPESHQGDRLFHRFAAHLPPAEAATRVEQIRDEVILLRRFLVRLVRRREPKGRNGKPLFVRTTRRPPPPVPPRPRRNKVGWAKRLAVYATIRDLADRAKAERWTLTQTHEAVVRAGHDVSRDFVRKVGADAGLRWERKSATTKSRATVRNRVEFAEARLSDLSRRVTNLENGVRPAPPRPSPKASPRVSESTPA